MGAPLICAISSAGIEAIMSDSAEGSSPPTGLAASAAATGAGTTLWVVDLASFGTPLALSAADLATASWKLLSDASLFQNATKGVSTYFIGMIYGGSCYGADAVETDWRLCHNLRWYTICIHL